MKTLIIFLGILLTSTATHGKDFKVTVHVLEDDCKLAGGKGMETTGYWEVYPFSDNFMLVKMGDYAFMASGALASIETRDSEIDYVYTIDELENFGFGVVFEFLDDLNMRNIRAVMILHPQEGCVVQMLATSIQEEISL